MGPKPRTTTVLVAATLAFVQVVGSFGAASNQSDRRAMDAVAVLLVLAGPAALLLCDRWPLASLAVALAAVDVYIGRGHAYGPVFFSVIVALFAATDDARRRRATWALTAVGFAGFVLATAVDPRAPGGIQATHLSLVAAWLVVALAVAELVRVRRAQVAERARQVRADEARRAGEQRLLVAQELHDVLAHNISLINVQASVALHLLDDQPDQARPALATIKEASRDALHELRVALDLLRSGEAPRAPAPRLAELDQLLDGARAGGLAVRLDAAPPPPNLPGAVELAAYRIVQEALTNVARHAAARNVTVRVTYSDGVSIEVVDDGIGGPSTDGNGIRGMRERAAALGGSVSAGAVVGGGFRVAAELPTAAP